MTAQTLQPTEIRLNQEKDALRVDFEDGEQFTFSAEFLRVNSPSAEVKGHSEKERKTVGGKRGVKIFAVEPTGNYAVRLTFSDGHSTGIYSWSYFYEIGKDQDAIWERYLRELEEKGMTRG